jgi:hypothetical protein
MNEFALSLQGPRAALTEASGHEIDPGDGGQLRIARRYD